MLFETEAEPLHAREDIRLSLRRQYTDFTSTASQVDCTIHLQDQGTTFIVFSVLPGYDNPTCDLCKSLHNPIAIRMRILIANYLPIIYFASLHLVFGPSTSPSMLSFSLVTIWT